MKWSQKEYNILNSLNFIYHQNTNSFILNDNTSINDTNDNTSINGIEFIDKYITENNNIIYSWEFYPSINDVPSMDKSIDVPSNLFSIRFFNDISALLNFLLLNI